MGSGTYATVFHGSYLGNDVAVKKFKNDDSSSLKAFITELEIMKWLRHQGSHPNVIHMFGYFTDTNFSYIVLELAKNGTVYEYLRRNKG